ncbi:MAG: helix-hairpin-helix domain-containing protein [bacterium]
MRLVSELTGWKIDIKKASDKDREQKESNIPIDQLEGLGGKVIESLIESGHKTLGSLRKATVEELTKIPGIGGKTAEKIVRTAVDFRIAKKEEAPKKEAPKETPPPVEQTEPKVESAPEEAAGATEQKEETSVDEQRPDGESEEATGERKVEAQEGE